MEYGRPFVTLLPRDPHCVFAQWELPGAADGTPVLRLYDLTGARAADPEGFSRHFGGNGAVEPVGNGAPKLGGSFTTAQEGPVSNEWEDRFSALLDHHFVDFEAVPSRHGMYIRIEAAGRSLVARIGLRQPVMTVGGGKMTARDGGKMVVGDGAGAEIENARKIRPPANAGSFQPVATSNVVHLPPGTAAEPGDDAFPWVSARPDLIFGARPDLGRFGIAALGSTASSDFAVARSRP